MQMMHVNTTYYHTKTKKKHILNEKVLRETQTLRAGCSKAEPTNFTPPQTPFPGTGEAKI